MKTITLKDFKNAALLLGLIFFSLLGHAQTTQTFNSSGNFIVPAGVTSLDVQVWGAGGAGGGNPTSNDGGGGGGGGAYSRTATLSVTAGTTHAITVGTGSVGTTGNGAAGGLSQFGASGLVLARGGAGGFAPVSNNGGIFGAGGLSTTGVGITRFSGGNGGTGRDSSTGQGGPGGSSAGTATNGTSGTVLWTTITAGAPPAGSGIGGNGGAATFDGLAGTIPGGGGGGAGEGVKIGGAGANGRVIVTWTCPTYALTAATSNNGPLCGSQTGVATVRSSTLPSGTYTVTYNLGGATTATANTATMTFTAGSPGTGSFTTSVLGVGTTNIFVTHLSSGAGCSSATGSFNSTSIVVNPILTAGVSISSTATTICAGTNVIFTATPTNGGTTPIYQWKVNAGNVGSNSATYSSTTLNDNDNVTCVMTSNATPCLIGSPATSNIINMTVNPTLSSVSIAASPSSTVCAGTSVTFTATPTNGGTTPVYQWKINGVNVGINSSTYSSSILTNGNTITCVMTSNALCVSGSQTSNTVTMIVNPNPTITGSTAGNRINSGTVVLGATASAGSVFWYTTLSGGGAIGGGTTWTTPPINTTTTFYAAAQTISGCQSSPRTAVIATVYNPEIDIQGNASAIADGSVTASLTNFTDFGSTNTTRTYTIYNTGVAILNIGTITFSGTAAADFTVTTPPASTVAVGGSTTFVVTFIPSASGTRTATISIGTDDFNENPYDFTLQGTGLAQEINVTGNGVTIVDGDTSPTIADWTDFTNITLTRTYTIQNLGNVPLNISSIVFSGLNPSEFTVTTNPATPVPGYSSTTFVVTFTPVQTGVRAATVNIVSDDANENPYDYTIIATGVNVDTDSDGVNNSIDTDDDNDGITDTVECGNCLSDPFINGSFESSTPILPASSYAFFPVANVPGWQATENVIELWSSGFLGVPAASGNQFAELNANIAGTLYQTFCLNGASGTITWSIKHRGRSGFDEAFVKFGSTLANAIASTPIVTMVDGTSAWGLYSGTYIIPAGQTQIVLAFQAGYTASGNISIGNFIDDVQITINQACIDTDKDGIADIIDVDDDNDGIPDIEEAGFKAYSNNTATMDKTNPVNWVDANGNGMNDYIDSMISGGTYSLADTDGDGRPNYLDLDSDNDSLFDVDEAGLSNGDGDINGDGKGDGLDTDGDGLLNLYDNSATFGSAFRAYAQNTDGSGTADYVQLDSNNDGTFDIATGLYGSLDANNDGRIDGTGDIDRDGITDTFDTNTAVTGSPRDINRKLFLDFDGRNDYGQGASVLTTGLPGGTLMAWIDMDSSFATEGVIVGQDKFQLRITSAKYLEAVVNFSTITYGTPLTNARWYHVGVTYDGVNVKLFVNGTVVRTVALSGSITADASLLTIGRHPSASSKFFKGKIDEVRVFNIGLSDIQFQRMVYQEIQNTSSQVRGTIVPRDISSLPFANVLRYYRMDTYKDDIIDDLTTVATDTGSGMKIYNHKYIAVQQAPMPFVTLQSGSFATATDNPAHHVRGQDVIDSNSTIIQVKHNITESNNNTDVAMFVDSGITISMNNDNKIENDWYLKLDGQIDLVGKSQLVQTTNSELDVTSAGAIERDQKGQSNKFNYNYWSSPVGAINTTSNNAAFTVNGVLKDGTNPSSIQNINWVSGYNGSPTSPVSLSNYWIFKFQNLTPLYANWASVGPNGSLLAAQGFTLKGSGAATATQNYTFAGKPNNGTITTPIAPNNANLGGNPYPSALDANAFIIANSSVITGTIYFWEHFPTNTSHNLLEYQGGYAARNLVGGTPPVKPAGISNQGSSTRIPGRFIPVGQGFLVYGSTTGGNITFDNSQRAFIKEDNVSSNIMFRQNVSGPTAQFDNSEDEVTSDAFGRIRLGFNPVNEAHRQILLGFMDQYATAGFDPGYDAPQIDNNPDEMSFSYGSENWVIQGDGYFSEDKIYPLAVKSGTAGEVNFTLDATENFNADQKIYIYDNVTSTYNDIREEAYHVTLPIGTVNNRFSLRFKNPALLANNNFESEENVDIQFTNNDNTINIENKLAGMTVISVDLYNMLGQSVNSWNVEDEDQKKIQIPVRNASSGTYIIKVHTTNGDTSKKMIIK